MPVMLSVGTGADVMKRIAAPLIGGLTSSTILTLVVLPAIYTIWKYQSEIKHLSKENPIEGLNREKIRDES
jgi:Cu(I)/Ag(I) efflux system membrane protein CusA/SilA